LSRQQPVGALHAFAHMRNLRSRSTASVTREGGGRIGTLVIYDFYLKIILGFTVFWYTLQTGFSAQTLFDDGYLVTPPPPPLQ
jgi:hypothetical protein